jgi:5'-deoxy-5'-methylthioadenosine phosphorylase
MHSVRLAGELMSGIAIIGGSGLSRLEDLVTERREVVETPYGAPSSALTFGTCSGTQAVFLARHGDEHSILPHRVNYCANLAALKQAGATHVIAVCAVGGISENMPPGKIVIPDQIIDYTWSRRHTIYEDQRNNAVHIDFTEPYSASLRTQLIDAAGKSGIDIATAATYGATQGPRLETAAEINRMERDGCHIVGMTGMPEASIARELGLCYAVIAVSVNHAAGRADGPIEMQEIEVNLTTGMGKVRKILGETLAAF